MRPKSGCSPSLPALASLLTLVFPAVTQSQISTAENCAFRANPSAFLSAQSRAQQAASACAVLVDRARPLSAAATPVPAVAIPRRSFIDAEIFGRMTEQNVASARLTTDEEFLRRVSLDLTGRIPSPDFIQAFVLDKSPDKRDRLIDQLIASPEFLDKWTMWMGDLLRNTAVSSNVNRQLEGRDAFHNFIRGAIAENRPLWKIAYDTVSSEGMNFAPETGMVNFAVGAITPMGPIQDTYDMMLNRTATAWLGVSHYDCLLCHNGRGHLDAISLWGSQTTRLEAERMAAFFARMRMVRQSNRALDNYNSYTVTESPTGTYDLNTTFGNRPNRVAVNIQGKPLVNLTPIYQFTGATPRPESWRASFAEFMLNDPLFARNLANRLWKSMFNLGLVEPVDTLDPARLDPDNPPPAPWTLQAANPRLLEELARELKNSNYDLRAFLRLLAQSSAYQLSSSYQAEWKLAYVPLFARHYPRRLEGEEVHDAIVKATGIANKYAVQYWPEPVQWAMQLPEPAEPRSNGAVLGFLNSFFRGDRDTVPRSQSGSILQQLYLMNDPFVTTRVKKAASPTLQAVSRIANNDEVVNTLFLLFLSRQPVDYERSRALTYLAAASTPAARDAAIEDLAWVCINKVDFLFSY